MTNPREYYTKYLTDRRGMYGQRFDRYNLLAYQLIAHGMMNDNSTLLDVGAGWTEFDFHLRTAHDWMGRYIGIDAGFDGTLLEETDFSRYAGADYIVCTEVLEHLHDPMPVLRDMLSHVRPSMMVVTVPNPAVVDVLACDPTHVSVISAADLESAGFGVCAVALFGKHGDTLLGVRSI